MAQYNSFVITDKGRALMAKTIAGESDKFRFTEIATSDKTYPESALAALTELASVKQQVKISKIEKFTDTQVKIEAAIENSAVADGYYINTIGLYAADDEEEVLYAVCTAAVAGYIPEFNNISAAGSIFEFVVNVGSAEKVSLEIDPAAVATVADMKQHKEEIQEELKGKADVGHSHVSADITDKDTTPTSGSDKLVTSGGVYGALSGKADTDHTHTKSEITDFPTSMKNPNSLTIKGNGTILTDGTYDGSAAKTVNITPSSIGAAASSHGTHVTFTTTLPKAAGTASVGSATTVSRSDHVHPIQTTVSGNAGSATKLATSRNIDGVSFNGSSDIVHYAVCSSNSNSVSIALNGFKLVTGARVFIKFDHNHTKDYALSMNINGTGSKKVYYGGYYANAGLFQKDRVYEFVYDGTNYQLISSHNTNELMLPTDLTDTNFFYFTEICSNAKVLKYMPVVYSNITFYAFSCRHHIGTGVPATYDFANFTGTRDSAGTVLYNCQLQPSGNGRFVFENINFQSEGVPLISDGTSSADYDNTCYVFKNCNFFVSSGGNGAVSTSSTRLMTLIDSSVIFDNCNFYADASNSGDCLHMIDISRNKTNNYPVCIEVNNCKMIHRDTSTTVDVVFATTNGRETMISINNSYIEGFNPVKATSNFYTTGPYGLKINNCEFKNVGTIGNVSTYTAITTGHITITNNTFHNYVSNGPITLYGYGDNCIISNNSFKTYDTTSNTGVNIYLHGNLNVFSNNVSNGYMKLYEYGKGTITGNIASTITQPTSLTTTNYIKTGNFPAIS